MAGRKGEFLIATINLNVEVHAREALALLEKNDCRFLERTGETSSHKQKVGSWRPMI